MRAVVTGGGGFIGSAIVDELLVRGDEVVIFDRRFDQGASDTLFGSGAVRAVTGDIGDVEALIAAFQGAEEVYHLAGRVGTSELNASLLSAIEVNVLGSVSVFEAAATAGVARLFYPTKPNVWSNAYTITKLASEQFACLLAAEGRIQISILRYFNAFGPRQALGSVRKIVPTFAAYAVGDQPLEVFGDGEQTVDLIFTPDLARTTVDSRSVPISLPCGSWSVTSPSPTSMHRSSPRSTGTRQRFGSGLRSSQ